MVQGQPVYIAILQQDEYAGFRERDPTLPPLYPQWLQHFTARKDALEQLGATVISYPIRFDEFVAWCEALRVPSLDEAMRDSYAGDQASRP